MFNEFMPVDSANFCEAAYLAANPDVAAAVGAAGFKSGRAHFELFGKNECHRRQSASIHAEQVRLRDGRIRSVLQKDMPYKLRSRVFDVLANDSRERSGSIETENLSHDHYDSDVLTLIEKHANGLILDCGAGSRSAYYENVINVGTDVYSSTDVCGVGEVLPFKDNSFDAVFSLSALKHVKDTFQFAREIVRVLKPGGDLLCCIPLQPAYEYPHHYSNVAGQGLADLLGPSIAIHRREVPAYALPISSLTSILKSWASGLSGETLEHFKSLKVGELLDHPASYLDQPFVRELPMRKNFELASAVVIHGTKRNPNQQELADSTRYRALHHSAVGDGATTLPIRLPT